MIFLQDLLAVGGQLHGTAAVECFDDLAFDSRRIRPGQLFVAVQGDTGDGHDYILDAVRQGAAGVLCQDVPAHLPALITCILVPDTRQTLFDWARYVVQKYGVQVIGVTGSGGKTLTKEAIAAVLGTRYAVFKNYASYSGRYGLPIAMGQLEPSHRIAVLELAADSVGEIGDLAALARPRVGVILGVHHAHMEIFGSLDGIAREKARLAQALPGEGLAMLNRDDERVWAMRHDTAARVIGFGFSAQADWQADRVRCTPEGLSCVLSGPEGQNVPLTLSLWGRHHLYAALAAATVGQTWDIPPTDIQSALQGLRPLPGRLSLLDGLNGAALLDDSYDAGADCMLAALDALADHFPQHRRIAVLGDIRQAGAYHDEACRRIGQRAAEVVQQLVLKGERTQVIHQAALAAGMRQERIFVTYTNQEAARYLAQEMTGQDAVLIKGAREERLEQVTRALLADPAQAEARLVRQEAVFRQIELSLPARPTWLEIDLEAIAHNLRLTQQLVGPAVGVMVVLKADGYGHGAARVARTAMNNGARMLGVACLSEGVALRRAGIEAPILVLGYTPAWQAREALLNDITVTLFDVDTARAFNRAATQVGRAARAHIKVDTGMGRLGLLPDEVLPFLHQAVELPHMVWEGVFTHLSMADEADKSYALWQLARFAEVLRQAQEAGWQFPLIHAANSAAILSIPQARLNMVRLGIALYGLAPAAAVPMPDGFRRALSFKTRVAQVKTLPEGSLISYGGTYRTPGKERIAVIPVGYADGFRRAPHHWGEVLVHGQRAPIVGRVCMDQTMINVTHIPAVRQGDEVVLIGQQGDQEITVEQVAARLGTIHYEVVAEILARVPRVS